MTGIDRPGRVSGSVIAFWSQGRARGIAVQQRGENALLTETRCLADSLIFINQRKRRSVKQGFENQTRAVKSDLIRSNGVVGMGTNSKRTEIGVGFHSE